MAAAYAHFSLLLLSEFYFIFVFSSPRAKDPINKFKQRQANKNMLNYLKSATNKYFFSLLHKQNWVIRGSKSLARNGGEKRRVNRDAYVSIIAKMAQAFQSVVVHRFQPIIFISIQLNQLGVCVGEQIKLNPPCSIGSFVSFILNTVLRMVYPSPPAPLQRQTDGKGREEERGKESTNITLICLHCSFPKK